MKTKTLAIGAAAILALVAGCGTGSSNSGSVSSGGTSSGASSGGTSSGASSGGASSSGASSGGTSSGGAADGVADAGSTDTGSSSGAADTGASSGGTDAGPKETKCQPTNQVCIGTCSQKACAKETSACSSDAKCAGLMQCLNGCSQGVNPPGEVTGTTCQDKCRTISGKAAYAAIVKVQSCRIASCVEVTKCASSGPGANECLNVCVLGKCADESFACDGDPNCSAAVQCMIDCQKGTMPPWPPKGYQPDAALLPGGVTPTTCQGKCFHSYPSQSIGTLLATQLCTISQCIKQNYTAPCPQTNNQCLSSCRYDKCGNELMQCMGDEACRDLMLCAQLKSCPDQACLGSCQKWVMKKHGQAAAGTGVNNFSAITSCLFSRCAGMG